MTFHPEAMTPACSRALDFLRGQAIIQGFHLAGGTALALQIGHRVSTHLDWFSTDHRLTSSERRAIRSALSASGDFMVQSEADGELYARLLAVDVSFVYQHHPLIEPTVDFEGVPLATPTDIGLMKLAAINSRGRRRDFVDLYCLRRMAPLDRLLDLSLTSP